MICPVVLAHEMSALAGGENRGRWRDGLILEGRGGAGHEGTGSDLAGDGQEDYLVAGQPRSSGLVTGRCGAGISDIRNSVMTVCSTGHCPAMVAAVHLTSARGGTVGTLFARCFSIA